jgi:hypothetical protein
MSELPIRRYATTKNIVYVILDKNAEIIHVMYKGKKCRRISPITFSTKAEAAKYRDRNHVGAKIAKAVLFVEHVFNNQLKGLTDAK